MYNSAESKEEWQTLKGSDSSKYEAKMQLVNKLIVMQKLKIATLSAGRNEVLDWGHRRMLTF